VVVIDRAAADAPAACVTGSWISTSRTPTARLLRILSEEKPDAIVHLACVRSPLRDATYAHELNALGALHVTAAAGEAGISRLVMGSTTLVYGARGDNPNFLSEEHPLRPDPQDRFVRDFVEAESFARAHQKRHPESKVTVLRFAPLTAPDVRDYRQRLFESPYNMTLMGYDPLLQAMSPDDAVEAIRLVLDRHDTRGVFNIAPDGVLPLSAFHLLYATLAVPLPHPLAYAAQEAAWLAGVGLMPGVHSDYFRYLCVADNQKAKRVLGFEPNLSTLEAVLATVRVRRGKGRLVSFDELEEVANRAVYRFSKGLRGGGRPCSRPRKSDTGSRRAAQ
jgi:UDP-glucose 4-epimerase